MQLTLLTHNTTNPPAGFKKPLNIPIRYGDKLKTVLTNLTQFRSPESQINAVYNAYGQQIPVEMVLKENTYLYIDLPVTDQ